MPVISAVAAVMRWGRSRAASVSVALLVPPKFATTSTGVPAVLSAAMRWRPGVSGPTGNATTQKPGNDDHGP